MAAKRMGEKVFKIGICEYYTLVASSQVICVTVTSLWERHTGHNLIGHGANVAGVYTRLIRRYERPRAALGATSRRGVRQPRSTV